MRFQKAPICCQKLYHQSYIQSVRNMLVWQQGKGHDYPPPLNL